MSAKKVKINGKNIESVANPVDPVGLAHITRQTRNLLAFHLEMGLTEYPAAAKLSRVFAGTPAATERGVPSPVQDQRNVRPAPAPAAGCSTKKSVARQLEVVARNVNECRSCSQSRGAPMPGCGNPTPRLFVLGDCYTGPADQQGAFWGAEEDELFWKMMAAIGLDREQVYITNCIKCSQQEDAAESERVRQCFTFLEQELMAVQPELICTLGEVATSLLLKQNTPLVRMRGRFHEYHYPHGSIARVMPTFHPRFLLQQPEMKRAAWLDLQAVQRQLPNK